MDCYFGPKIAFLHIPKTAGTSIKSYFMRCYQEGLLGESGETVGSGRRHDVLGYYAAKLKGIEFSDLMVYASIRNPFAVVASLYFFAKQYWSTEWAADAGHQELKIVLEVDFAGFVSWYCKNWPSMFDFIEIDGEVPENVRYIKRESIDEDVGAIIKGLEITPGFPLPHERETGFGDRYREFFDGKTRKLIEKKEKWILEHGYTF